MKIAPDTTITLYSGVEICSDKQLAFSTPEKQAAYFLSKRLTYVDHCTTVKNKIGYLKVPIKPIGSAGTGEITGAQLATCNYMSFVNKKFDNKTIYCYIVDYSFENNECAYIQYVIDYWQTWCFDVTFRDSYIDREHLSEDDWNKVEANPYRSDVPQMVTAEPLATPTGYEKPFYKIKYGKDPNGGDWDHDSEDGFGVLATKYTAADLENMLRGYWSYWNVMLVLAPTDWSKFDEGGVVYPNKSIISHKSGAVRHYYETDMDILVGTEFDDAALTEIFPVNINPSTGEPYNYGTYDVPPNGYIADPRFGKIFMYRNKSNTTINTSSTITFDDLYFNKFEELGYVPEWNTSEIGPSYQYQKILDDYNIKVYQAGEVTTDDGKYTWSAKPRGCDVLIIRNQAGWKHLADFLSLYNAVSQIVGIYGVPTGVMDLGTIDTTGETGSTEAFPFEYMSTCDTIKAKTSAARTSLTTSGVQKSVTNKKLLTFPFSYIRAIGPNRQIKEYSYELFNDVATGTLANVRFKMLVDICGDSPRLYFIPDRYKVINTLYSGLKTQINTDMSPGATAGTGTGTQLANCMEFNLEEAICIEGFPEISFNTDGYLTFLGDQYATISANNNSLTKQSLENEQWNTSMARNQRMLGVGLASNIFNKTIGGASTGAVTGGGAGAAIGGGLGAVGGLVEGGYNYADAYNTATMNRSLYENIASQYNEAKQWAGGALLSTDDPNSERFNDCKAAYANNLYTGGYGGTISYLRGMGMFDIVILHVQLRSEILDYYDKWFDLYGYASGRCGVPHIYNFMHQVSGVTTNADLPHWSTVNNKYSTYIKTHDAKVEHAMLPVAAAITAMFNAGVRFQKGDLT